MDLLNSWHFNSNCKFSTSKKGVNSVLELKLNFKKSSGNKNVENVLTWGNFFLAKIET